MGIIYTVQCDLCMHNFADNDDRVPDVSTYQCDNCNEQYCDNCPEKLKQCQECGGLFCECTEFFSNGCENCRERDE